MWLLISSRGDTEYWSSAVELRDGLVLGRSSDCAVVFNDPSVSRKHLSFRKTKAGFCFECLGPRNRVDVAGRTCRKGVAEDGTEIVVGTSKVRCVSDLPTATRSLDDDESVSGSSRCVVTRARPFRAFVDTLVQANEAKVIVERLLDGLLELLAASRGYVLLRRNAKTPLRVVAYRSLGDVEDFVGVSSTICRRAMESRETVHIENSLEDLRCAGAESLQDASSPVSILCSPLGGEDELFGVLYIDGPMRPLGFSKDLLPQFETMVSLASEMVRAVETRRKLDVALELRDAETKDEPIPVLGQARASQALQSQLLAAASQDVTVLLLGETGAGKEVVARAIHRESVRSEGPFVAVNCAALPRDLVEAELFGAEAGAYTGAKQRRIGRFELAEGGTLLLDEVGELAYDVQVKLLRVLEDRRVTRLGASEPIDLDFRLMAATNANLQQSIADGDFRQDLYYRLAVFPIMVPPLRERSEDILGLAKAIVDSLCRRFGKAEIALSKDAEARLVAYCWPGNIRELHNVLERAVVLAKSAEIDADALRLGADVPLVGGGDPSFDVPFEYTSARDQFDQRFFERSIARHGSNVAAIARESGVSRPTLYRWFEKLGIGLKDIPS